MLKLHCNGDLECLDEEDEEDCQGSVNSLGVIRQKIQDLSEPGVLSVRNFVMDEWLMNFLRISALVSKNVGFLVETMTQKSPFEIKLPLLAALLVLRNFANCPQICCKHVLWPFVHPLGNSLLSHSNFLI